ncbi:hypothetical protein LY78DRAFT_70288 [Colletotrichum sublineola]|nr:hypothetical protein LY78DRAFT_70288 [Colletotrichum sublineola]
MADYLGSQPSALRAKGSWPISGMHRRWMASQAAIRFPASAAIGWSLITRYQGSMKLETKTKIPTIGILSLRRGTRTCMGTMPPYTERHPSGFTFWIGCPSRVCMTGRWNTRPQIYYYIQHSRLQGGRNMSVMYEYRHAPLLTWHFVIAPSGAVN